MLLRIVAFIAGLLFGLGMMISDMVDPVKVLAFLDVAGAWDPSLAFVMAGALAVFAPFYAWVIAKREKPVCATSFHLSQNKTIDSRLITGSVLFGLGWGIAGICPGPALTSLGSLNGSLFLFVISLLAGTWLGCLMTRKQTAELIAKKA